MSKLLKWIVIVVVILAVIYTAGWFFLARTVKARIFTLLEGQGKADVVLACGDVNYKGFPLDFGFSCDEMHVRDRSSGMVLDTPQLSAEAPVYSPWTVFTTVTGPVSLESGTGALLRTEFDGLDGKLVYRGGAPRLVSFDLSGLVARFSDPAEQQGTLTTERAQALVRNNDGDLDVALTLTNAVLRPQNGGNALDPVSLSLLATVDDGGPMLDKRLTLQDLRGKSGLLNEATIIVGESDSRLALSGRFSFDKEGYLDGRFSFELTGIEIVAKAIELAYPPAANAVATISGLVKTFTGGKRSITMDVRVSHGRASMGLIPLGKIPPI